ncbi:MAG TPA: hypothetical protein VM183_20630 [Burkholderiales bacterium]|nr:hypothetical protein [Burkholderiales bacterium]
MDEPRPLLSVSETRDGVWSVNERGPSRVAIAYFPSKWGAIKHAVRVAHAKPRCRVAVVERDGTVRLARDYQQGPETGNVEI